MAFARKKNANDDAAKPKKGLRTTPDRMKPVKPVKQSKSNAKRFVLIVGDEGSILVFMQGKKVLRRLFAPSAQPAHSEAMQELMKASPSAPIYVLMDVMDQQYVPQTFPPVSSLSVGGLVKRRLDRDFQPDDFKGSIRFGRDKSGRKEWKFLLVSLPKTPLVSEWINCIIELPNELKGIYLVPIEARNYIQMLAKTSTTVKPAKWQLLFTHNKVSGFRQVVLRDDKLVLTRVSQAIDDAIPAVIAGNIEQEIINTIEYLKRLELGGNAQVDATVIVSQDVIESLDLNRFGFGQARALTPLNVADALGLEQAALSADRFGDVVMAAAFGIQKKQLVRFSNAYIEKLAKFYKLRMAIRAIAALAVVGVIGLCGLLISDMVSHYSAIDQAESKAKQIQPELEKMKKSVDGLNHNVAFKPDVVAAHDAYIKDMPKPEDFIDLVAPLLSRKARITYVVWDNKVAGIKPVSGAPAIELPIAIEMEVDFGGAGNALEEIDQAAKEYVATLTEKLPQYDIKHEPFPWSTSEASNVEAVEVDVGTPSVLSLKSTKVKFTLNGLKKVDAAQATPPGGGQ